MKNKILSILLKASGCLMAFSFITSTLLQNSTCASLFHQPKMPESLIDIDE